MAGTHILMVYANGAYYTTYADINARFGSKIPVVWVDVNGSDPGADVLDVETYDATVQDAVVWVRAKKKLRTTYPPIIYCNRATLTPLFNCMNAAGFEIVRDFRLGVATLDMTTKLADMTGVTFVQFYGCNDYDDSMVYDSAWKLTR